MAKLVLAASILAILDTAGVAIIFPFLAILTTDDSGGGTGPYALAYRWLAASSHVELVIMVSAILAAFFILKFVCAYLVNRMKYHTNAHITTKLSDDLFRSLLRTDYTFLANNSVSEMTGIINAETIHATLCLDAWVIIGTETLFLMLVLMAVGSIDIRLAALIVSGLLLLTVGLYFGVVKRTTLLGVLQTRIHLRQYRFLFSVVNALKDIKILGLEHATEVEHRHLNESYAGAVASFNVYQTLPRSIIELLVMLGLIGTSIVIVTSDIDVNSAVPVLGFLAVAALRLIPSYGRIVNAYASYNYYRHSLSVIRNLYAALITSQVASKNIAYPFEAVLEVQDLQFFHGEKPVLKGITLEVRKGKSVGIVGSSGSGKTTFLDVLAGLRRSAGGRFLLDNVEIDPYSTDALRRLLGYVPQNVTLIDDSIAFNISFDRKPDLQRLDQAVRTARIDEFIHSLPEGYHTMVGENGVRVSGGQKQRIGIARALYRNPQILIFDEATSSLDNLTERELNAEITALSGSKTLVIVAHRLTTVASCDEIYVFEDGRIAGNGTHASLLETCPAYQVLYQARGPADETVRQEVPKIA